MLCYGSLSEKPRLVVEHSQLIILEIIQLHICKTFVSFSRSSVSVHPQGVRYIVSIGEQMRTLVCGVVQ